MSQKAVVIPIADGAVGSTRLPLCFFCTGAIGKKQLCSCSRIALLFVLWSTLVFKRRNPAFVALHCCEVLPSTVLFL